MDVDDVTSKRGRGRGRATRARGRGRGRGRGRVKKTTVVVSSDEESVLDQIVDSLSGNLVESDIPENVTGNHIAIEVDEAALDINKENEPDPQITVSEKLPITEEVQSMIPPTIDMEADISQLEAPTFTTISRGPPEPMLRLKWDHKVTLIGEKVLNPMIHCCDQCNKPILVYGRMIPCKHIFCLKCARSEPVKICPRCKDKVVRVEQSGLGTVFMCTHGGSRYGNTGCRRTYLSQRDLQAHINHRHITQPPPTLVAGDPLTIKSVAAVEALKNVPQPRKVPETTVISSSTTSTTSNRLQTRIAPVPISNLTQINIARSNISNAQECHQAKLIAHQSLKKQTPIPPQHHQTPDSVADASYYSSVLNSYNACAQPTFSSSSQNYGSITTSGQNTGLSHITPQTSTLQSVGQVAAVQGTQGVGFYNYGQQFTQLSSASVPPFAHGQFDQAIPPNAQQSWNQQQYYR